MTRKCHSATYWSECQSLSSPGGRPTAARHCPLYATYSILTEAGLMRYEDFHRIPVGVDTTLLAVACKLQYYINAIHLHVKADRYTGRRTSRRNCCKCHGCSQLDYTITPTCLQLLPKPRHVQSWNTCTSTGQNVISTT